MRNDEEESTSGNLRLFKTIWQCRKKNVYPGPLNSHCKSINTHPGRPPDSMWLARVTSCDHTSNCHLRRPITPHSTLPECTPTRMLISTPVASRTCLEEFHSHAETICAARLFVYCNTFRSNCCSDALFESSSINISYDSNLPKSVILCSTIRSHLW